MNHTDLWFISRATGVVSIAAMTAVVVLGTLTAARRGGSPANRALVMGLHRTLGLGMSVFLVMHVATAVLAGYVDISWLSVVVPFTSGYERLWLGLGTLAADALIAVVVTSVYRDRLSRRAWRAVHWLAYALWPLAIVHGITMSSADQPILLGVTIACAVAGAGAIAARCWPVRADAPTSRGLDAEAWA